MIWLERNTEDAPDTIYDDVKVQIGHGFETTTDDWVQYLVGFLQILGYGHDQIIQAMKDCVEAEESE